MFRKVNVFRIIDKMSFETEQGDVIRLLGYPRVNEKLLKFHEGVEMGITEVRREEDGTVIAKATPDRIVGMYLLKGKIPQRSSIMPKKNPTTKRNSNSMNTYKKPTRKRRRKK